MSFNHQFIPAQDIPGKSVNPVGLSHEAPGNLQQKSHGTPKGRARGPALAVRRYNPGALSASFQSSVARRREDYGPMS